MGVAVPVGMSAPAGTASATPALEHGDPMSAPDPGADDSPDPSDADDPPDANDRPAAGVADRLRDRPAVAAGLALLVALIAAYTVLIRQEILLVAWFLVLLFLVHLALRFVRAVERIAGAVEALADREG